jgi:hypothetical protein
MGNGKYGNSADIFSFPISRFSFLISVVLLVGCLTFFEVPLKRQQFHQSPT